MKKLLVLLLVLSACTTTPASPAPTTVIAIPTPMPVAAADIIFRNGTVITMENDQPQAEAMAIQGEKILAVGGNEEILAMAGSNTQVVDLQGRTLMPGFVDPHTHLFNDAGNLGLTLEQAQQLILENGITTLGDPFITEEFLKEMQSFDQEGKLQVRTSLYLIYTTNCGELTGDWWKQYPPTRQPGEMLRIAGVKMFADGGSCMAPAVSFEFPNVGHGDLFFSVEELSAMIAEADAQGYQVVIHAAGDRAVETVLDAYEMVLNGEANNLRHRIDHNSVIRPDLFSRYHEVGAVPLIFGAFPTCFKTGDTSRFRYNVPPEYQTWEWPWRQLLDANPELIIAWHGDDPYVGPISPLLELFGLVTRAEVREDGTICQPTPDMAAGAVTVEEALPMMTINAAYALFRDKEVGSLKPEKYADLIILSDNPLTVDSGAIKDISILMTMVGGRVEYCAQGYEALCPRPGEVTEMPTTELISGRNLALNQQVTASNSLDTNPPAMAVDGNLEEAWISGDDAPQWIEIDLGSPATIGQIRFTVAQDPAGETVHQVWGRGPGEDYRFLYEFSGFTTDGQALEYTPLTPWTGIQFIRVETVSSSSWVAWQEIELFSPE